MKRTPGTRRGGRINLLGILLGLGEAAKKPIIKDSMIYFARYSGGQSYQKWGKDTVQEALNRIATEIHSQYELAYAPYDSDRAGLPQNRGRSAAAGSQGSSSRRMVLPR